MKVVVTGGAGILGRWVIRELMDDTGGKTRHDLTVLARSGAPEQPGVRWLLGDVRDLGQVYGALAGADAVVHLAAIRRWGIAPNEVTFQTNVMGTFNVHEAAWRLGIRRVVSTSSEAVLGWDWREREFLPESLPIDEDHPVKPQDAYGLSKEAAEAIARAYSRKSDMVTVVLRPPWIVEPEQLEQLRAAGGRQPTRWGLFSYVDVRDLAEACRLAIERPLEGHHVLFILGDDTTVAEPLCDLMPRYLPGTGEMARHLTGTRAAVSNARAKAVLGWHPRRGWRNQS